MDPIYVTGHRNPDTDSIVAAMAYASLRNALGDREYEAACLGRVSDETQSLLDRFGFQPPKRITSMHTQIKDLEFDKPPVFSTAVTMGRAWEVLEQLTNINAIPVANEDGTLYGMLSRTDVADYNMGLVSTGRLDSVPLFNLLSVLEGKVLNEAGEVVTPLVAIGIGTFLSTIVDFLLVALVVFIFLKVLLGTKAKMEALRTKEEEEAAAAPAEPPAPPAPSAEEVLLTEIRDLLKNK